jgi:hypothetical protein
MLFWAKPYITIGLQIEGKDDISRIKNNNIKEKN